jgi:excisionase family DNA binding protein
MPKDEKPRNLSELTVAEVAELLGVTDRWVRNWIKDKGLPVKGPAGSRTLDWPVTLKWYVAYQVEQNGGSGGTRKPGTDPNGPEVPLEDYEQALARKTRAEADLKELQLARERGEAASIADVEKALTSANAATKKLIQALPSVLSTQLLGVDDRSRIYAILERETNVLLGNLATVESVFEAGAHKGQQDDDE